MSRLAGIIAAGTLALLLGAAGVWVLGHPGRGSGARTDARTSARGPSSSQTRQVPPSGLMRAERAFLASYAAYLDGRPDAKLRSTSITARSQARAEGPIPQAFRDGSLRLDRLSAHWSLYSAQVSVVLANREERYPFAVQLLDEPRGWQVSQLQAPDLSMDRAATPFVAPKLPAAAARAARRFALGYARYRTGLSGPPTGLAPQARAALASESDSLAGIRLGHLAPRIESLTYGPLSDGEFSATATVTFASGHQSFSLLMEDQKQTGAWLCAAFL